LHAGLEERKGADERGPLRVVGFVGEASVEVVSPDLGSSKVVETRDGEGEILPSVDDRPAGKNEREKGKRSASSRVEFRLCRVVNSPVLPSQRSQESLPSELIRSVGIGRVLRSDTEQNSPPCGREEAVDRK